jgi:hypothetical protein
MAVKYQASEPNGMGKNPYNHIYMVTVRSPCVKEYIIE